MTWFNDFASHPDLLQSPAPLEPTNPDQAKLIAPAVTRALAAHPISDAFVVPIDPELADTAVLTETYSLPLESCANCVLVAGVRAGEERIAACIVLANTKADVNKHVRKLLDVRKASFLPMERATEESGMEYGGIGPIGLPEHYRILVDARVVERDHVIIGSGIRGSKIILPGAAVGELPGAEVVADLAV